MRLPFILGSSIARTIRTRRQNFVYIALCIFCSLIVIAISVSVSFTLVVRDKVLDPETLGNGMNIAVELVSLDPVTSTVVIDMFPLYYEDISDCSVNITREFDIFIDPNLSPSDSQSTDVPDSGVPKKPVFTYIDNPCNFTFQQSVPTIRKTIKLFTQQPTADNGPNPPNGYGNTGSGLQAYPFDSYYASLYFYVLERLPGNNNKTTEIVIANLGGVVANFDTNMSQELPSYDGVVSIDFDVKRSAAVKLFCLTIIITNWVVSLVFLWITIACLFWKERVVKELFAIPISVLFAFSAVRGSMPGAPAGFGAFIDFVGILPNLAVLTVCSIILILLILIERIRGGSPEPEQSLDTNSDAVGSKEDP